MSKNRLLVEQLRVDPATKQPTLLSGETIKTLNGSSILGSGNITVITDISMKQDNLVSGNNIKTLNGSSILGSGNIDIVIPTPNVYIQADDPSASVPVGTSALWIQKMPDGTFDFKIIEN